MQSGKIHFSTWSSLHVLNLTWASLCTFSVIIEQHEKYIMSVMFVTFTVSGDLIYVIFAGKPSKDLMH